MSAKVQLTGGQFQDAEGNVLDSGYLLLTLSQDSQVNGDTEICAGYVVRINLNSSGSVDTTTAQYVWGNDVLDPANTFYTVKAYTEAGQLVWGPNAQQVTGSGTFDVGTWVPGSVNVTGPTIAAIQLQTNGVTNASQTKLNLIEGSNVTLVDDGSGGVTISSSGGGGVTPGATGTVLKSLATSSVAFQQETYSVKDFGATGNGTTDDTTAISSALSAASSGGIVYFPNGTYIVSGIAVSTANTWLQLSQGATIKLKAAANTSVITITANHVKVSGGTVDGNNTAQSATTGCYGVYANASASSQTLERVVVEGVIVQNTVNAAIRFGKTGSSSVNRRGIIRNNFVNNTGSASVAAFAEGIALFGASETLIEGNVVSSTANHAILSTEGSNNRILGNDIYRPGANFNSGYAHCVAIDGNAGANPNSGHVIDSNYCFAARDHGIEVADSVSFVTISNNIVDSTVGIGTTPGGIYFGGGYTFSEYCTISGNQIYSTGGGSGIIVQGPSPSSRSAHCSVIGNVVYNTAQHGIFIDSCDECVIDGNIVMNSSKSSTGSYDGLNLTSYSRITITGNRFADNQGTLTQRYGINFTAAPAQNATAMGNTVEPNLTGTINIPGSNGATGLSLSRNPGYNPNNATFTPSVPSTGAVVTNSTGVDVMVFITSNSAATQVLIGGTSGAHNVVSLASGATFSLHVPAGQTVGFVYSGSAPTWQWIGE